MEDFYSRIDSLLKVKKSTQKDLCAYIGTTPQSFTNSKAKKSSPSADTAVKIASFLDTTVEYLVTGKDPDTPFTPTENTKLHDKLNRIKEIIEE